MPPMLHVPWNLVHKPRGLLSQGHNFSISRTQQSTARTNSAFTTLRPDHPALLNHSFARRSQNKWDSLKEEKAKQWSAFPVGTSQPPPPSACLPSFPASNHKGPIWQGGCGSRKNPEMASESSRQHDRVSEVKAMLVTFSSNPLNWQVGERRCREGLGKAPEYSQLTFKWDRLLVPRVLLALF